MYLKTGELKKLAMRSKECATKLGAQTGKCFLKISILCFNPTHTKQKCTQEIPLYDHFFPILFTRYLLLAIARDSMLREMELTQSSHYCVLTFCWKEAYTFRTKFKPRCYHENTFWLQNVKSSSSEQIG